MLRSRNRAPTGAALAALVAAGLASLAGAVPAAEAAKSARPAVDAQRLESALRQHDLRSLDGTRLDWNQLSGEVVVVSFWASWCKPCHREMPELDALHNELAKRGGRVVAISIDLDAENARRFAASRQLSLPIYHDGPRGLAKTLDLRSIPYTVVLDRQGAVAFATAGSGDEAMHELKRVARQLAGKEPLATAAAPGSEE